ncbi:sirohydrochlorin cobaltochelatase [Syntrophotalea carbinolica DSM 2380]|uniref:Sirohydrochlorin cobaltochelatase n=1 Tax=Syntrophotalea carbinolica (strain DSM 2380 / NBRC 103641 / GraBd1) TaxID=338963 RepID=Q3A0Y2_SYNC1|nr:CbiX/SirB N-terminal domain-containing protein [Syntrophotalea carbinolica]ABA89975.2 sirohydrochlorin cobaltochelatase [Syntrophotalea carbinolica DSM 2380]
MRDKPSLLIVGHGTRHAQTGDMLQVLADRLRQRLDTRVAVAFLAHGAPRVAAAIDSFYTAGVRQLVVIPFFLSAGVHVTVDLPGELEKARHRYPALQIVQTDFFGAHPAIGDVLCKLFSDGLERACRRDFTGEGNGR